MNQLTKYGDGNPLDDDGRAVAVHQHIDASVAKIAALLRIPVFRERDVDVVERRIRDICKIEGDALYYEFPVTSKNGEKGKVIGPSVKLAYAMVTAYGNCATDCEVVDTDDAWIFNATFVDRETGTVNSRLYRQRKSQGSVKGDKERQLDMAFQIGQSKAIRNVVVNSLRSFADRAVELAQEAITLKIEKKPEQFRDKAVARLSDYGIAIERVNLWIGCGPQEWKPHDIARVISALQAVTDGVSRADDIWPAPQVEAPPAPPPPTAPPVQRQEKAQRQRKADDNEPTDSKADLAEQFTKAPDIASLDLLWEQNEKVLAAAAPDDQARFTKAYDDRRLQLEQAAP